MFGTRFFLYLGVLGFGMLVLWAIQTEVEITATATGKVIPTGKVRMVQNLEGGIVQGIFVQVAPRRIYSHRVAPEMLCLSRFAPNHSERWRQ